MKTPAPPIDLSPLRPVMQQALAPFVLPVVSDSEAFHKANDARALRLQMTRPQTVEGWFL